MAENVHHVYLNAVKTTNSQFNPPAVARSSGRTLTFNWAHCGIFKVRLVPSTSLEKIKKEMHLITIKSGCCLRDLVFGSLVFVYWTFFLFSLWAASVRRTRLILFTLTISATLTLIVWSSSCFLTYEMFFLAYTKCLLWHFPHAAHGSLALAGSPQTFYRLYQKTLHVTTSAPEHPQWNPNVSSSTSGRTGS